MFNSNATLGNSLFSFWISWFLEIVHPFFLVGSFPFIAFLHASQPSTYTSLGISQDTCPIKTLLKVVEGAASYKVTIQGLLPH